MGRARFRWTAFRSSLLEVGCSGEIEEEATYGGGKASVGVCGGSGVCGWWFGGGTVAWGGVHVHSRARCTGEFESKKMEKEGSGLARVIRHVFNVIKRLVTRPVKWLVKRENQIGLARENQRFPLVITRF